MQKCNLLYIRDSIYKNEIYFFHNVLDISYYIDLYKTVTKHIHSKIL
jgi:hypothetical protein